MYTIVAFKIERFSLRGNSVYSGLGSTSTDRIIVLGAILEL